MPERELTVDPGMTYGDLRRYADTLAVNVCSRILPHHINGLYDESLRTIVIDRSLNYTQKRCTLVHELVHWSYYDHGCERRSKAKAERRTRRLTAQALVPASRGEALGEEYEGDIALVANELNVTVSVLEDFWKLVYPRHESQCGFGSQQALSFLSGEVA